MHAMVCELVPGDRKCTRWFASLSQEIEIHPVHFLQAALFIPADGLSHAGQLGADQRLQSWLPPLPAYLECQATLPRPNESMKLTAYKCGVCIAGKRDLRLYERRCTEVKKENSHPHLGSDDNPAAEGLYV